MWATNVVTVRKLRSEGSNNAALIKYSDVGKLFARDENKSNDYYIDFLLDTIQRWTVELNIPGLRQGGVSSSDFEKIVHVTNNKNNPVVLNQEEMLEVLALAN